MEPTTLRALSIAACGFICFALPLRAADAPAPSSTQVSWSARATSGADVAVPVPGKVTIVAFLRAGQEQSDTAAKQIAEAIANNPTAQPIVILSGQNPADAVNQF